PGRGASVPALRVGRGGAYSCCVGDDPRRRVATMTAESVDLARLRQEYADHGLDEVGLADDPVVQFRSWLAEAIAAGLHEPNAMVLSTVSERGQPSSRMVLLKGVDDGFVL